MAILNQGLNRVRDIFNTDMYSAVAGTSSSAISFSQTDLLAEDVSVEDTSLTVETADKVLTVTSDISAAEGNGETFYEWGVQMSSGNSLFNRTLTAGVPKDATLEIINIKQVFFNRQ